MAEAHRYTGDLAKAVEVFPDLPWSNNPDNDAKIFDEKSGEYVPVKKGQFIYKVGDRYEVRDQEELPKTTKPATDKDAKAVEKAIEAKEAAKAEKDD